MSLPQAEADRLFGLRKRKADAIPYEFPRAGGRLNVRIIAENGDPAEFLLDITRSSIALTKGSYNHRVHKTIVLARVCVGGAGHVNPDGQDIGSTHLHRYREGFADKWAEPLPPELGGSQSAFKDYLASFLSYCNVVDPPRIDLDLFS